MSEPTVRYFATNLAGTQTLADLPFRQVTFNWAVNQPGKWSGQLNVNDPKVAALDWQDATAPNKACLWVDIGGRLVWGGIVQTRQRTRSTGVIQVGATDHWGYFNSRVQAADYSTQWATTSTAATVIAHQILSDVVAVANSLPVSISPPPPVPAQYGVTLSWPRSQRMAVASVIQQLAGLGWLVGFDIATDVQYVAGLPAATITISYPRRGRVAGTTGLVADVGADSIEFTYSEDGSKQAIAVYEMGSASGGVEVGAIWEPALSTDGYPLLESVAAHSMLSPTPALPTVLAAMAQGDLAVSAYPVVTPVLTCPMFSANLPIGSYIVGDDINVIVPPEQAGVPQDPMWPNGLNEYFRIIQAKFTVADEGVSKQELTLALPPTSTPIRPPS